MGLGASHCKGVWAPREVSLTTLSTAAVFVVFTVIGNLLIILSVLLDPNKNLRRTPYMHLVDFKLGHHRFDRGCHGRTAVHGYPLERGAWSVNLVLESVTVRLFHVLHRVTAQPGHLNNRPLPRHYVTTVVQSKHHQHSRTARIHCYLGIVSGLQWFVIRHRIRDARFRVRQLDTVLHSFHPGVFVCARVLDCKTEGQGTEQLTPRRRGTEQGPRKKHALGEKADQDAFSDAGSFPGVLWPSMHNDLHHEYVQ